MRMRQVCGKARQKASGAAYYGRSGIVAALRSLLYRAGARPRGGVVTQRTANPRTPVQFRAWPPALETLQRKPPFVIGGATFRGSSVVEQPAVNRLVAGSNPARGANSLKDYDPAASLHRLLLCHSRLLQAIPRSFTRSAREFEPQCDKALSDSLDERIIGAELLLRSRGRMLGRAKNLAQVTA